MVAVAVCLSVGLHWGILQSAAWAGMVIRHSESASLTRAIEITLDGNHPCSLCRFVQHGSQSQQKQDVNPVAKKFEASIPAQESGSRFFVPVATAKRVVVDRFGTRRTERPSLPPPKSV